MSQTEPIISKQGGDNRAITIKLEGKGGDRKLKWGEAELEPIFTDTHRQIICGFFF